MAKVYLSTVTVPANAPSKAEEVQKDDGVQVLHAAARPLRGLTLCEESSPIAMPATLDRMQVAHCFGLAADAVALVLVIGDAVLEWLVAMMSCRRVTGRPDDDMQIARESCSSPLKILQPSAVSGNAIWSMSVVANYVVSQPNRARTTSHQVVFGGLRCGSPRSRPLYCQQIQTPDQVPDFHCIAP